MWAWEARKWGWEVNQDVGSVDGNQLSWAPKLTIEALQRLKLHPLLGSDIPGTCSQNQVFPREYLILGACRFPSTSHVEIMLRDPLISSSRVARNVKYVDFG